VISAWIDARAAELTAQGMTPANAHAQAIADFGDAGAARRYCATQDASADHRVRWRYRLEETVGDLRIAARMLRRAPTVTFIVLLTFALGVGAMTAVFSAVHAELLRPLPYDDESTLAVLHSTDRGTLAIGGQLSAGLLGALRERTTSFSGISAIAFAAYSIVSNGEPEAIQGARVTAETFTVLGARPRPRAEGCVARRAPGNIDRTWRWRAARVGRRTTAAVSALRRGTG
jgi:hypothetical protein